MRLLLLGCSGFIGRELVPHLLHAGHELTVVSRKSPSNELKKYFSKKLIFLQIDPSIQTNWQKDILIEALKQSNGVINFVGEAISEKRWSDKQCKEIERSRLSTTKGLIDAMNKLTNPPSVLINGSAIGFYGTSPNNQFTEDSPNGKDFLAKLCKDWENIATKKPPSTRLVIFRIGIVLGTDGGALGKMLPIFRAGFGGPIGNGQQWMSWIHLTDLCLIIEKALQDKKFKGVINAIAPKPSKMYIFSETLGKALGRPTLLPIPAPFLKLILGDGAKVVLEGQFVLGKRLEELQFKFKFPDLEQALKNITKA